MPENSKFNLMNLASHGRWDSYERFRSHRSGGIQGFGARARAPQQLPLNGQRLIPRQPGKWQKWQTGKLAKRQQWMHRVKVRFRAIKQWTKGIVLNMK